MASTRIVEINHNVKDIIAELSLANGSKWNVQNTGNNRIYWVSSETAYVKGTLKNVFYLEPGMWGTIKVTSTTEKMHMYCEMDGQESTLAVSEWFD